MSASEWEWRCTREREFEVAGISFKKQNVQTVLNWKKKGHQLCVNLVPDPENRFDENAIKVLVSRAEPGFPQMWIGYVPRDLTNKIKPYLSQGSSTLSEIGPFSAGYYARVICKKKENVPIESESESESDECCNVERPCSIHRNAAARNLWLQRAVWAKEINKAELKKLKKAELKDMCIDLGLQVSGNKKVLIDRIRTGIAGYFHYSYEAYNNKKMVDIQTKYTVEHNGENYFVYSGTCDNKRTKWITRTPFPVITGEKDGVKWEEDKFSITLQFVDGKMQYRNGVDNSIMMIYEGDEEEYGEW